MWPERHFAHFPNPASSMVSPRIRLKATIVLFFFGGLFLLTVTPWRLPHTAQTTLDVAFANQFDALQRLTHSLSQSVPHIRSLRVDSVALEDLSYVLTAASAGFSNNDMQQRIYALSQEVDATATLMQTLYVEVDVLIHL